MYVGIIKVANSNYGDSNFQHLHMCENLLDEDANADWTDVSNIQRG